jgi:hypothetical protein
MESSEGMYSSKAGVQSLPFLSNYSEKTIMTQEIRKDKKEDQANLGKKYVQNNKIHSGKWKVQ